MNASKPRRPRSPAVPSRNLEDAFADTKRLYNTYTHGTFSKSELASALGVSATSGPFAGRFFSLKEYGLIDGANDSFRASQRFIGMKDEPTTSATFKRSALEAIRSSAIFAELLSDWKTKLPPREAVATRLEQQKKFNPDRAKEVAAVLEESLRFAGVLDANNNILPIRERADAGGGDFARDNDSDNDGRRDDVEHGKLGAHLRTDVPLGDGRRMIVSYPNDLTEQEAQKVGNVLKAIVA